MAKRTGTSNAACKARVVDGLNYLFDSIAETRILLVTHGEVLRTIYRLVGQTHKVSQKPGNASIDVITLHLDQLNGH